MTDADPSPVAIRNAEGKAPLVLVCDHASRALPAEYAGLGLDETELRRHIAWDIGAADVATRLSGLIDAPVVLSGASRLLVDCNRATDDPTFICQVSDGTVVPGNRGIDGTEVARRIARFHRPYHEAIAAVVGAKRAKVAAPALFSIHSFTPVMRSFERPWHVGILWDKDARLAKPLLAMLAEDPAITVGDNEPYSGRSHVGYTMMRHGAEAGLPHVLIELRQDLVDTHRGAELWAERLAGVITRILARFGPFQLERHWP
ncbi:MAG TPA: N-formylglutamate amidohydrolase [Candidatus Cybelea sp.]|nr:N-formylglutamate amidohydrolase [Candidatus Cybelea sp.]